MMENHLRYQIGQMLIMGFEGYQIDETSPILQCIQDDGLGGVILFDYHYQTQEFAKNIRDPDQVQLLNQTLQTANTAAHHAQKRPLNPLIISVDYEGGRVNRLKETRGFPVTLSPAQLARLDDSTIFQHAEKMARTLQQLGFNLDFAPLLDININPLNPVIAQLDRSFSADPQRVAHCARIFVNAFATHKIQCAYKHFPGHGSSEHDSHLGFVDVSNTWQNIELQPYQTLLAKPQWCKMIMTAHIINRQLDPSGLPATLSHTILSKLLRETLQYQDVIVTDDMQMKAISDHFNLKKAIPMAIRAGADMLIIGNQLSPKPENPTAIIDLIESEVHAGNISAETIAQAYQRIRRFKQSLTSSSACISR